VVTYHDTREDAPEKLLALARVANATIIHEPVRGLAWTRDPAEVAPGRALYLRQGIPGPARIRADYWVSWGGSWMEPDGFMHERSFKAYPQQSVLGTVGFNFPWKNFDRLATLTAEEGWALLILSANATEEDEARWRRTNPACHVLRGLPPEQMVLGYLAACDATAFPYECANTGTSGAIRLGIGARKPVLAFSTCRQFRDLYLAPPETSGGVVWSKNWDDLASDLRRVYPGLPSNPHTSHLAHRDRWGMVGAAYAEVYRRVLEP